MRNSIFKTFLLVATGVFVIFLISCESDEGSTSAEELYGTWTLDNAEYSNVLVGGVDLVQFLKVTFQYSQTDAEAALDIVSADIDSAISTLSGTVTFNEDETYEVVFEEEDKGTWHLSTDGNVLTMQSDEPGELSEDLKIESVSSDMLVLIIESEEGEADFNDDDIDETELSFELKLTFSR